MDQVHLTSSWKTRSLLTQIPYLETKTDRTSDTAKPQNKSLHTCPICLKELSSEPILTRHYREIHNMNKDQELIDIKTFSCPDPFCNSRPFKRTSQLRAHLVNVHDRIYQRRKSQHDKRDDEGIHWPAETLVASRVFPGAQRAIDQPRGKFIYRDTPVNLETMDQVDWNPILDAPSSWPITHFSSIIDMESFLHGDVGIGGQQNFYAGSQMQDEVAQSTGVPEESDDQTKFKMISAIREKYTELTRIDEQIRILEELKANRSNISKDIAGLEGNYQEFIQGARHV